MPKVVVFSLSLYFFCSIPLIGLSLLYTHLSFRQSSAVEHNTARRMDRLEGHVESKITEGVKAYEMLKIDVDNNSNFRRYHLQGGGTLDGPHPEEKDRMLRDAESHADPVDGDD